jgi:hypothetical protein
LFKRKGLSKERFFSEERGYFFKERGILKRER